MSNNNTSHNTKAKRRMSIPSLLALILFFASFILNIYFYSVFSDTQSEVESEKNTRAQIVEKLDLVLKILKADQQLFFEDYQQARQLFASIRDNVADLEIQQSIDIRLAYIDSVIRNNEKNLDNDKQMAFTIRQQQNEIKDIRESMESIANESKQRLALYSDSISQLSRTLKEKQEQLNKKDRVKVIQFESLSGKTIHYLGEVQDGKANGGGVGIWPTGSIYRGDWKENRRNGKGTIESANGERYEGQWVEGRREGVGTYYWPSGERYEGEWKNNRRNGQGTLFDPDGNISYKGKWKDDKPQ